MESPNQLVVARGDAAIAAPRTTTLVGRGITALGLQRQAALLAEAQHSRYQAARAVFDRQCCNTSKTMFTDKEAQTLYAAYCTLRELADAGYMRACYPVARFLSEGWRILPHEAATRDMLAADRVERIRLHVMTHALSVYQDDNLETVIAKNPLDLVSVIEWCAEYYPSAIQASKAPRTFIPIKDFETSLTFENAGLAWLNASTDDSPEYNEILCDIGDINRRGYSARDAERAFECFKVAAENGYARAQRNLGTSYAQGLGVAQDDAEAVHWYKRSADQGDDEAQFKLLATSLEEGSGSHDDGRLVRWTQLSADQGSARAQCSLGILFLRGRGVMEDEAEAVRWMQLSAHQGNIVGQSNLAWSYCTGTGVAQDYAEALRWCRQSAGQGSAFGQCVLAMMYSAGWGIEKDDKDAARWFLLSARQGDTSAQYLLGRMYELGDGLPKDECQAASWYALSAQQGNDQAQYNLGLAYEFGRGVTRDLSQAQYWYQKSADQNHADAMGRLTFLLKKKLALSGGA